MKTNKKDGEREEEEEEDPLIDTDLFKHHLK